ncbi:MULTISPECIES: Maf family protein [Thiomicrorhabdus]|uniref:7-methyl-GTP pyrophosphatase n=1 Tax=Thiomicrorhabdus heinhorstiae TaxID=2748010 RepID=A0ABS0BZP3_9GAMM|nr:MULTISPECIES: Maf family nucleotide pyrophosphatase [Thiomicrorhabdus]MBF6058520.1 septum formation inhibitor Maf [Thiomicrorhabdus heinhorstiae]
MNSIKTTNPKQTLPPVILGSSSAFRKLLLEKLHFPFTQATPDIDETPLASETPQKMVTRLAQRKAEALAEQYPDHILITSDQCAVLDDKPLGKPHTFENAFRQLSSFSGRTVRFYTSLHVRNTRTNRDYQALDITEVEFRDLADDVIRRYLEIETPLNCAGSFKSEGLGITLFKAIRSIDPNALIGLPLIELTEIFYQMGYPLPLANKER